MKKGLIALIVVSIGISTLYAFIVSKTQEQPNNVETQVKDELPENSLQVADENQADLGKLLEQLKKLPKSTDQTEVGVEIEVTKSEIKINSSKPKRVDSTVEETDEVISIGEFIDVDSLENRTIDDEVISIGEFVDADSLGNVANDDEVVSIGEFIDADSLSIIASADEKEVSIGEFIDVDQLYNNQKSDDKDEVISIGEFILVE